MLNKLVKTKELYASQPEYLKDLFESSEYPWEMLPKIKEYILALIEKGLPDFTELKPGVWVGKDVKIADFVTIEAPAIIGHGTEIRPGAYIRGSVITGSGCVLGNSSEFKNCILLDKVQVPHYNYVGDSILGYCAHMGAGSICSNLKSDKQSVVIHSSENIDTKLRKVGAFLASYDTPFFTKIANYAAVRFYEKQIKSGSRKKKLQLISEMNPEWVDLSE